MKDIFIQALKDNNIWHTFLEEYGFDWEAKFPDTNGWHFAGDVVTYRALNIFDDHITGKYWFFTRNDWFNELVAKALKEAGFKVIYDESDENDAVYQLKLETF